MALVREAALQVVLLLIAALFSGVFLHAAIRITAATITTAVPRVGAMRLVAAGLILGLLHAVVALAFDVAFQEFRRIEVIEGVVTLPGHLFATWPVTFFVVAGLAVRFLPTTLARACLVATAYVGLEALVVLVIAAMS